jgi:predicted O-methyltransferase YrrM
VPARLHLVFAWLRHWLLRVDEHSIHSPFFYELYTRVIRAKPDFSPFADVENYRRALLANPHAIEVTDLGSGTPHFSTIRRPIAAIAATSPAPPARAHLYYRLAAFFKPKIAVELGTSFGLSTLYLQRAVTGTIYTIEGCPAIAAIAQLQFEHARISNIKLIEGAIDEQLPRLLDALPAVDFALIDANHRFEPTVRYFLALLRKSRPATVLIVDDIHQSPEMEKAWNTIRRHELVYANVDLFSCGLLFLDPGLNRQSWVLG